MAQNEIAWISSAFENAKNDFVKNLKHPERYDFTKLTSAEVVYEEAVAIERRQAKSKSLSALRRIDPYIRGLEAYVGVIDTFAQCKADLLCLIWVCCSLQTLRAWAKYRTDHGLECIGTIEVDSTSD